jgi:NADPH:quinone reductase-like Zn-dependent oxidoreductase
MKAVSYDRFGGPELLEYVDLPEPTPGPRQLVIVRRTGGWKAARCAASLF